jgi:hypothetical protein
LREDQVVDNLIDKAIINRDDFTFRWKGTAGDELYLGFESKVGASLDRLYKETENNRNLASQE